ncbi:MAG: DUF1553 domain-containing protein [Pirellulales bacterium]
MVNRVWRWHFGRGIVATPNNFGLLGERPTDQALLDWLAVAFVRDGWSLKSLHRQIMLSATYRMSSDTSEAAAAVDPGNQRLGHFPMRRLDAEEIRDALLAVSDQLDPTMGGPVLAVDNRAFIFDHTSKDETSYDRSRRSIYLPVVRNHLHECFMLFDYSDASTPNGNRNTSTVASQALYLMNGELVATAAQRLADRVLSEGGSSDATRTDWLYQTCLARPASDEEVARVAEYLQRFSDLTDTPDGKSHEQTSWQLVCQALLISSEFVYVE